MKLDIIVPHYKEPWDVCRYLFSSLELQRGVPFNMVRVIVVNDGDDNSLDLVNFDHYPFEVVYLQKDHAGVSAARNYGLDYSDADYVMFCDIDDGFLNNWGLHLLFSAMQEGFDYLVSNFVEETFDEDGNVAIINHDYDLTFMHGKVYRRQFLIDNDLRFDPDMTLHEDGYFNAVAFAVAQHSGTIRHVKTPVYMWRWNDNSVVRSNRKNFVLKTYPDVMKSRIGICKEFERRGYTEDLETAVCMTVLNSYYDFQKTAYTDSSVQKYFRIASKAFKGFWNQYKHIINNCTNQRVAEIARVARENAYKNGMLMEQTDLKTWLRYIDREVKI